jgi:SAM-dependent methyltransferase
MNRDNPRTGAITGSDVKACCAAAYQRDVVGLVLGDSYHPGGLALTRHLGRRLALAPGQRVLDVASGPGTSAVMLAREFGVSVVGVDLGEASVAQAREAAQGAGLGGSVSFQLADAERLPFPDASFDAVVCECAFCTFPDKPAAAGEVARVLRPGGRLGITDVTVEPDRLNAELRGLAGWVACIADARPVEGYAALLASAGLALTCTESHDDALGEMIEAIETRLRALRLLAGTLPALSGVDFGKALEMTALAARAVAQGCAGYVLLIAEKTTRTRLVA